MNRTSNALDRGVRVVRPRPKRRARRAVMATALTALGAIAVLPLVTSSSASAVTGVVPDPTTEPTISRLVGNPTPASANFYAYPTTAEIDAVAAGGILRWQPIAGGANLYRVMYRTTHTVTRGGVEQILPVAATASVFQPPADGSGRYRTGGLPTIATPHGLTGVINANCHPSRSKDTVQMPAWVRTGGARVVTPDFVGLGTDPGWRSTDVDFFYGNGIRPFARTSHPISLQGEGRATLDAARAARLLELVLDGRARPADRNVGTNDDLLLVGQSQGGHGALGAAELHALHYAPDLDLKAVVAGAPAGTFTDLTSFDPALRKTMVPAVLSSMSVEFKDVHPGTHLNIDGLRRYNNTFGNNCALDPENLAGMVWFQSEPVGAGESVSSSYAAVAAHPAVRRALAANSPGHEGHPRITVPVFVGQVLGDPLITPERTDQTVRSLRDRGAAVVYCKYRPTTWLPGMAGIANHSAFGPMWTGRSGTDCTGSTRDGLPDEPTTISAFLRADGRFPVI